MYKVIQNILSGDEFSVVEQFELSGRPARYAPIPRFLFSSRVGIQLHRNIKDHGLKDPLWAHQAQALELLGSGNNVVVSTGTASGKSLIFQSFAFHKVLLGPGCRILAFYPLKALAADQMRGWKNMARTLDIEGEIIGRIDGSTPVSEREELLQNSRIVVMTPDVCHAWLMRRLSAPVVKDFVRSLSTLIMDEAHTLEGVFGSNFAFLIRRLIAARNHLLQNKDKISSLQLVAATATIKNPGEHMKKLTGSKFSVVDHEADGAPQHERLIAHIACASGEESHIAKLLHTRLLNDGREGVFITFLDSRKGVEGLAIASGEKNNLDLNDLVNRSDVLPYRAGYDVGDRQRIEQRLQSGSLRGVISTSALELGIDIPYLRIGFNIGVPGTRKAYRQRIGRIGRNGPSAFIVIAPHHAFYGYGTSFQEYHEMSVEPSYLYLDNRFMQFAHGRCLAVELESLGSSSKTPTQVDWPTGFNNIHASARHGGNRPPEFDAIAALGADTPHFGYPLRNVGEMNFQLKIQSSIESLGDVNQLQALRECYPGATYLHLARPYEVVAWHTRDSFIRLKPTTLGRSTKPRIKTWINAGITSTDIQEDHIIKGENGFLAECHIQVTEKVEGFVDGRTNEFHSYQELQQRDPNMSARSRNFRTSGVVLCIKRDWFKGPIKRVFADRLHEVFIREFSVAPQDVNSAASNISIRSMDGGGLQDGCIAVYDETYGSLRLTERLYLHFENVLDRLLAATTTPSLEEVDNLDLIVERIKSEVSNFTGGTVLDEQDVNTVTGYERVFEIGSRVCHQPKGLMAVDVEIIQPTVMDGNLMYQVKVMQKTGKAPVKRWLPASDIEPPAITEGWGFAWWNRETQEYEEPPHGVEL